ncbi:hypothetical protein AA958_07865 [Streptomyces sp. CNQ-509]|uniref:DUF3618 domain-containing protein n=1 Tax=unclassified Streptomyces TaxID=2593676 RepID=UPI00062E0228|nr:DUF3618 domain-containing protein [Streptomyces sp. CNQ-509]AKH82164.1 hypothetical protein AA958_07865 [Streptomyces sp. CNQ-509]
MGTASPEKLRAEIEDTRSRLTADLDRLAERVSPRAAAGRQGERVRGAATGLRERVMGSATESTEQARERTRQATEAAGEAARQAPERLARQTQGNPLAAGLVAFGAGMLAASMIPESPAEERAAAQMADRAGEFAGPVKDVARESAQRMKEDATQTAKEAAREVKERTGEERR